MPIRNRSPRRRIVVYALLLAGSLLLLAMGTSAEVQELRRGINYALSPVQEVLAGGARSFGSIFSAFTEIDQLRREKRGLEARVTQLEQQIAQLEVLRTENARLSGLLGTKAALDFETVAAFAIGRSSTQFERVITIDRGREAGIEVNFAVLSAGGVLVGVVTEALDGLSTVRLLSDTRSLVIGMDVTSRATGELVGNLSAPLVLGNVPGTETLAENDTVVTAGQLVGGIKAMLPRDLLIGTIVDVIDTGQFVQHALVQPAADLDHLEAVLVITSYRPPRVVDPAATPDIVAPDPTSAPEPTQRPGRPQRPRRTPAP